MKEKKIVKQKMNSLSLFSLSQLLCLMITRSFRSNGQKVIVKQKMTFSSLSLSVSDDHEILPTFQL